MSLCRFPKKRKMEEKIPIMIKMKVHPSTPTRVWHTDFKIQDLKVLDNMLIQLAYAHAAKIITPRIQELYDFIDRHKVSEAPVEFDDSVNGIFFGIDSELKSNETLLVECFTKDNNQYFTKCMFVWIPKYGTHNTDDWIILKQDANLTVQKYIS